METVVRLQPDDQEYRPRRFEQIIGKSSVLRAVLEQVERVAPTDSTVLIQGETGTGKGLIAHAIHTVSRRWGRPFIKLNCAAIPFDLLESELFGHEKGAFTGAIAQKIGRFELADTGTLFLDEIGDISLALQPKLLRVLQEQEFERLGSGRTHEVDVRLVAATHRDLTDMIKRNEFRSDLYYRLNVFPIQIPPLRERRQDIVPLVVHFVEIYGRKMGKRIEHIAPETLAAFKSYRWPGNIRELQNLVERAVILSNDGELPNPLPPPSLPKTARHFPEQDALKEVQRKHILAVLEETNWVLSGPYGAAARLRLKRTTLISKMRKFGICRRTRQQHTLMLEVESRADEMLPPT
jgi:transcriptional regulator with GAF, ATPase, and Fis domain